MPISDYIEKLSCVKDVLKNAQNELGVFADIYHCYLEGCGEYWTLSLWKTTGQKMNGDDYYHRDFDTIEQLAEHLELLVLGARIFNGEEI